MSFHGNFEKEKYGKNGQILFDFFWLIGLMAYQCWNLINLYKFDNNLNDIFNIPLQSFILLALFLFGE